MDIFENLNKEQAEAVRTTEGPLLILAGAGSGKTRTLTHRIAYLMREKGVDPFNIMAITFTNKAAQEMRERVNAIAGFGAEAVWVSTFHSACARILRRYADRIGYGDNFSIYDTDDSKLVIKNIIGIIEADTKKFTPRRILSAISSYKNQGLTPADAQNDALTTDDEVIAQAFEMYEKRLFENNAMDFDDLLLRTVELFKKAPDVLEGYQNRLRYISVDEYQDTNIIQFELVRLLAGKRKNLCVVGDDDQSIYKFRGADIRNILEFEKHFPDAKVIKLEQNYRSTGNILKGANAVIRNNIGRKEKTLWTEAPDGPKIVLDSYMSAPEEASGIVSTIRDRRKAEGMPWDSFAILYRTNAQSRLIEEKLIYASIPYQIIGGTNFYSRKEIKDVCAYLKTVDNAKDDMNVKRIINVPRRGIGAKSIERFEEYAAREGVSFFRALCEADQVSGAGSAVSKVNGFVTFIRKLKTLSTEIKVSQLIDMIIKETGYLQELIDENTEEAQDRIENINELISKAVTYEESAEDPSLAGFLQDVALVADIDSYDENAAKVLLMTIHSAKGLEFDEVFLTGMEDGLFPGYHTIFDADEEELEEERRLCYVGMTRAKKRLVLTCARQRMLRGEMQVHKLSRFAEEIPKELLDEGPGMFDFSYRKKEPFEDMPVRPASSASPVGKTHRPAPVKAFNPNDYKVVKPSNLDFDIGDRVKHRKFGEGTVKNIEDGGRDFEVTIDFDKFGTKRMFASFAKLEKV